MSDAYRLKDKLAKLGVPAQPAARQREVVAAEATDFLRAVLAEFDETVLARKLTFQNETDALISFEVANRRLHSLTGASAEFSNSAANLMNQQFSETSDELIPHLTKLLDEFFTASQQIHIVTSRQEGDLDPGNIGCSAEVIAAANALVLYEDVPLVDDERTNVFVELCKGLAKAWVRFDENGIQTSSGDESAVKRLTILAKSSFSDFDKQLNTAFDATPKCAIVGATDNCANSGLYVKSGGQGAFMTIPTDRIAEAHKYWREARG